MVVLDDAVVLDFVFEVVDIIVVLADSVVLYVVGNGVEYFVVDDFLVTFVAKFAVAKIVVGFDCIAKYNGALQANKKEKETVLNN